MVLKYINEPRTTSQRRQRKQSELKSWLGVGIQTMKLSWEGVQIFSGQGSGPSENVLLSKWFQSPNSTPQAKTSQRYYTTSTRFKHRSRWMMLHVHFNCGNIQWVLKSEVQCTTKRLGKASIFIPSVHGKKRQ